MSLPSLEAIQRLSNLRYAPVNPLRLPFMKIKHDYSLFNQVLILHIKTFGCGDVCLRGTPGKKNSRRSFCFIVLSTLLYTGQNDQLCFWKRTHCHALIPPSMVDDGGKSHRYHLCGNKLESADQISFVVL